MINNYIIFSTIAGLFVGIIITLIILRNKKTTSLNECLTEFKNTLDELKNQNIQNSMQINYALKNSENLAKALTTNQNLKGQFGEECLENIIRIAFPNNNVDYFKQYVTKNSQDKPIKPDYIINLPDNKSVIIDCKLNLEKFISYKENISTEFEIERKKELIQDIMTTLSNLSNKKYETADEFIQPDFIFMYIPLEPLISLIYTDNDFVSVVKYAYDKNIIIVGNSGILSAIRIIKNLWSNQIQNENIDNIVNIAQDIYNLVAEHSNNLLNIKNMINDLNTNFDKEFDKIKIENKIFKATQRLKDFGIISSQKRNGKKLKTTEIQEEFLK